MLKKTMIVQLSKQLFPYPATLRRMVITRQLLGKISHAYAMKNAWDEELAHTRDPRPPKATKGFGPIHIPESEMTDTKYADFAIEQLQKKHDKPFFIACGIFHPHGPWYVPQKYFDLYSIEDIVTPVIKEDDLEDIPEHGKALAEAHKHKEPLDVALWKEKILAYLANTTYADAQIGRVLSALENSSYKDNTLVVLWSDHGYHMGEKKRGGKMTLWEEATHSLLMFKVPGMTQPKQTCARFVSLLDLYPTLVDLCNVATPSYLDGNSLVPLLKNPSLSWNKPVISGYMKKWERNVYLSARTENYRYIRYAEGSEEFYHCTKDPREWTNQINNPEYKKEVERHIGMLPSFVEPMPYIPVEERGYSLNKKKK